MTSFDKLYQKYAVKSPILPPSNDGADIKVPVDPDDIDPKWLPLIEESEGIDPLTQKPAQSEEELLKEVREEEGEIPVYEKELLQKLHPEMYGSGDPSAATIPPPKKKANFSPDTLLKMCSKYHDLCRKF